MIDQWDIQWVIRAVGWLTYELKRTTKHGANVLVSVGYEDRVNHLDDFYGAHIVLSANKRLVLTWEEWDSLVAAVEEVRARNAEVAQKVRELMTEHGDNMFGVNL